MSIGLIGLGKMGLLHSGIFNNLEDVQLKAISENNRFILDTTKKYLRKINLYYDYATMLEKEELVIMKQLDTLVISIFCFYFIPNPFSSFSTFFT